MKALNALLESRSPLNPEQICAYTKQQPKPTAFRVIVDLIQGQYLTETENGY